MQNKKEKKNTQKLHTNTDEPTVKYTSENNVCCVVVGGVVSGDDEI